MKTEINKEKMVEGEFVNEETTEVSAEPTKEKWPTRFKKHIKRNWKKYAVGFGLTLLGGAIAYNKLKNKDDDDDCCYLESGEETDDEVVSSDENYEEV